MNFEGEPGKKNEVVPSRKEKEVSQEVSLRRFQADDFPRLKEHWMRMVAAHPEEYSMTAEDIAQLSEMSYQHMLQDPQQIRFLSVDAEGNVLGTIGLQIDENTLNTPGGMRAEVKAVGVHPEKRGEKIGERMLQQLIEYAKQAGFSELTLLVRKENRVAKNLYAKFGFTATGKITDEEGYSDKVMEEQSLHL